MQKFSYIQVICLVGFQILLFFVFIKRVDEIESFLYKRGTIFRMTFSSDDPGEIFSGPGALSEWKKLKKQFINVDLTGVYTEDIKRLDFIKMEARRLKYTYDTVHILKVHFTNENTYGQFIQLASIMQKDLHKRYMFYQDDFYILGEAPPEQIDSSLIVKPLYY